MPKKYSSTALAVFCVFIICSWIFFLRWHTYSEPVERDLATYAVIAHEMLNGGQLYTTLWDHKPPAIYATLMLGEIITGYGPQAIFFLNVVATLMTAIAFLIIGIRTGGLWLGIAMMALWGLLSGDPALYANQPNTETFINVCAVWFFAFIFYPQSDRSRISLALGLLMALATLYKHVAIMIFAPIVCAQIFLRSDDALRRFRHIILMLAPTLAAWLLVFAYFALNGRFQDAYEALILANMKYAGATGFDGTPPLSLFAKFTYAANVFHQGGLLRFFLPTGVLIAAMIFADRPRRPRYALVACYYVGAYVAIALPGFVFPHYYQLWLPSMIIATCWACQWLGERISKWNAAPQALAGLVLLFFVHREILFLKWTPDQWSIHKYGDVFVRARDLSREIRGLLRPGENFYNFGDDPELYFHTQLRPPSGFLLSRTFLASGFIDRLTSHVFMDLKRSPPELIVITRWTSASAFADNSLRRWIKESYSSIPVNPNRDYYFLVMKNEGTLSARLASAK